MGAGGGGAGGQGIYVDENHLRLMRIRGVAE